MADVSKSADEMLRDWSSQKPVVALMGEFSAGKSTLVNLLLGRPAMQTQVTATQLPAVWLTFGETDAMQGLRHDGVLEPLELADLDDAVRDKYLLIRYVVPAKILEKIDIIDAPGISDPRLAKGATEYLGRYIDLALWCSSATQAWRQSEKKAWSQFPAHLRRTSAIVLTRKDKLRRSSDVTKVVKRVARETADLFDHVIAIDTVSATELAENPDLDHTAWTSSGGSDLFNFIDTSVSILARKETVAANTFSEENDVEAKTPKMPDIRSTSKSETDVLQRFKAIKSKAAELGTFGDVITLFEQLKDQIAEDKDISPTQRFVYSQCLSVGQDKNINVERLLRQVELEIVDFKADNWCTLSSDIS